MVNDSYFWNATDHKMSLSLFLYPHIHNLNIKKMNLNENFNGKKTVVEITFSWIS